MERVPAAAQETHDPVQASLASWDLERRVGDQAEPAQPGDERDEEIFVLRVVGDVDEHGVEGKAWTRSGSTAARCHRPQRRLRTRGLLAPRDPTLGHGAALRPRWRRPRQKPYDAAVAALDNGRHEPPELADPRPRHPPLPRRFLHRPDP